MTSIRQIARQTGFSPATVSRVLSHDPNFAVKETTRQAILRAAQEMHYQPAHTQQVRPMLLCQSRILVLQTPQDPTLAYYAEINRGIREAAQAHDLTISRWLTLPDHHFSCRAAASYQAVILVGAFSTDFLHQLYRFNRKMVLVDEYRYFAEYDTVRNNYEAATKSVLDLLYQRGHRRIIFIGGCVSPMRQDGSKESRLADIRTQVYQSWMQSHELVAHIFETAWTKREGMAAMEEVISNDLRADAVVTASDRLATGAYAAARRAGIMIPADLAVISFDDSQLARELQPPLSSVRPNSYEMGRAAVWLVLERLLDHRVVPVQTIFSAQLTQRGSV